jgi:hypothetical protein
VVRLEFLGTVASNRPTVPPIITDFGILKGENKMFKENFISAIPCPSQIPCVLPWD